MISRLAMVKRVNAETFYDGLITGLRDYVRDAYLNPRANLGTAASSRPFRSLSSRARQRGTYYTHLLSFTSPLFCFRSRCFPLLRRRNRVTERGTQMRVPSQMNRATRADLCASRV